MQVSVLEHICAQTVSRGGGGADVLGLCVRLHSKDRRLQPQNLIALSGSRRLRSTLAAAPLLFAHAAVTIARNSASATPQNAT